jgi:hypothetical protein
VAPLLLAAAGVAAFVTAGLILRTFGERYRIGRLLATTPKVTVAEANRLAAAGRRAYVRVEGRIDAEDEFEDEHHRPLVFRRVRLESRAGRGWRLFEDHRRAIPFAIQEGLDAIAIDVDSLGSGLIVIPRDSLGAARDIADRVPPDVSPETEIRARIDQVSSVEHAIVIGYPEPAADRPRVRAIEAGASTESSGASPGPPNTSHLSMRPATAAAPAAVMTSGRGRPLILTVLEPDEAMRILAAEGPVRTRAAALLLGVGVALLLGAAAWLGLTAILPAVIGIVPGLDGGIATTFAATPVPSAAEGGDPRSNGQGPGLVGTPGLAILAVVAIAVVSILVTTVYVRLTGGSRTSPTGRDRGGSGASGGRRQGR